ncbi:Histidinol-phosphate aminotransferase [compost metagenome]
MAIQLLPRLRRAGKVGVLSPCYAEHAEAWRRNGYIVREVLEQEVDFFVDSLDILVVVNPNNPTGLSLTPGRLLDWHARLAQRGGWLVVDEAFMDNTPHLSLAPFAHQVGLIVLRSFGKFFGLAGVRLGFVLAERKLLKLLAEQVGPWAVSGPTRVLGQACLRDTEGQTQQRIRAEEASERLAALLEHHGFKPQGGCALFQWLITDRAEELHEFMARRGILLRLFIHNSSLRFGLPGDEADWVRLDAAFNALTKEHP